MALPLFRFRGVVLSDVAIAALDGLLAVCHRLLRKLAFQGSLCFFWVRGRDWDGVASSEARDLALKAPFLIHVPVCLGSTKRKSQAFFLCLFFLRPSRPVSVSCHIYHRSGPQ